MGTKHEGSAKGFHHLSRAWYADACMKAGRGKDVADEVTFGFYHPDGGTSGEMTIFWEYLGGKITPYLKVWNDAWHTLYQFCDVLKEMSDVDDDDISPEQFCAILLKCGFQDMTATKQGE